MSATAIDPVEAVIWPVERLGDALAQLAFHGGHSTASLANPRRPESLEQDERALDRWLEAAGARIGVSVEAVGALHEDTGDVLASDMPGLLRHPNGVLLMLDGTRRHIRAVAPSGAIIRIPRDTVRRALLLPGERPWRDMAGSMLDGSGVALPYIRRRRDEDSIVAELMARRPGLRGWFLRPPPGSSFSSQIWRAGALRPLLQLLGAHAVQYILFLASWWIIGAALLDGRVSTGWLLAWTLLLMSLVPLRMLVTWSQGTLSLCVGAVLRRRLMYGTMRLDLAEIRSEGVGNFLGRSIEADAVENLALSGGFASALACIEFVMAAVVLAAGAGGGYHVGALVAWLALTIWLGTRLANARGKWTDERLSLTDMTVERMVGHRTRLAQEPPERWHDGEDDALWRYVEESVSLDRHMARLYIGVPRGWLLASMAVLAPAFIQGAGLDAMAVSIGGMLLAWRSFTRLVDGIYNIAGAHIAWRRVAPIYQAAVEPAATALPDHVVVPSAANHVEPAPGEPALTAHSLDYGYPGRGQPVLTGCELVINAGDRVLLQGPSGSGKSTLAALLLGTREPRAGLLLARGLDRASLGDSGWRRRVTSAPQFHENHVLTESFAFNLLMGYNWPALPEELEAARRLCVELGLGPLLERMPAGMFQMVGDYGWRLSHGERSRLFMARALLQDSDVVILDESFAALDPDNLELAMNCARSRARTLVVIAHP